MRFDAITRRHTVVSVGAIVIVFDPRGRFDGVVLQIDGETCASSYDEDAGTHYIDEHCRGEHELQQCGNCSRYGHKPVNCANHGVPLSDKQRRQKQRRHERTGDIGWARDRDRELAPFREVEEIGKAAARNAEIAKRWPNLKKIPARASP